MARQCAAALAPWSKRRVRAADFLFDFGRQEQSAQDMLAEARAYHQAHGAVTRG